MFSEIIEELRTLFSPNPITQVVDARNYAVEPSTCGPRIGALIVPPEKPTLGLVSLTGFLDAFLAKIDGFDENSAVQIVDHETVDLVSLMADSNGIRHRWLRASNYEKNPFPFDQYQVPERFLLSLQAGFLPTEAIIQLQQFASALSNESSISTQDDGFTQTVTVKQGAVTRGQSNLPKRIKLMPYRTFREIDPVESEFIVRLQGEPGKLPSIALMQVDAGKWKHNTSLTVKRYLEKRLPKGTVVIA